MLFTPRSLMATHYYASEDPKCNIPLHDDDDGDHDHIYIPPVKTYLVNSSTSTGQDMKRQWVNTWS